MRDVNLTYQQFANACKQNKQLGVKPVGRVLYMRKNICALSVDGNNSYIDISELVAEVVLDGTGTISNPSALKKWTGWRS